MSNPDHDWFNANLPAFPATEEKTMNGSNQTSDFSDKSMDLREAKNAPVGAQLTPANSDDSSSRTDTSDLASNLDGCTKKGRLEPKKSPGPKTTRGKRRSSKNAIRHGFFSKEFVNQHMLDKNDQKAYSKLLADLCEQWNPVGAAELIQVQLMATHLHQYKSILRLATAIRGETIESVVDRAFSHQPEAPIDEETAAKWRAVLPTRDDLDDIQRYESHVLRNYYRALAVLYQLKGMRPGDRTLQASTLGQAGE